MVAAHHPHLNNDAQERSDRMLAVGTSCSGHWAAGAHQLNLQAASGPRLLLGRQGQAAAVVLLRSCWEGSHIGRYCKAVRLQQEPSDQQQQQQQQQPRQGSSMQVMILLHEAN
jgi:hypothetical protein